ncbi:MAG: hypothetical protein AAF919_11625 [Pseudomonadota bacterium]
MTTRIVTGSTMGIGLGLAEALPVQGRELVMTIRGEADNPAATRLWLDAVGKDR